MLELNRLKEMSCKTGPTNVYEAFFSIHRYRYANSIIGKLCDNRSFNIKKSKKKTRWQVGWGCVAYKIPDHGEILTGTEPYEAMLIVMFY